MLIDTGDTICIMIAMCLRRLISADAADKGEDEERHARGRPPQISGRNPSASSFVSFVLVYIAPSFRDIHAAMAFEYFPPSF